MKLLFILLAVLIALSLNVGAMVFSSASISPRAPLKALTRGQEDTSASEHSSEQEPPLIPRDQQLTRPPLSSVRSRTAFNSPSTSQANHSATDDTPEPAKKKQKTQAKYPDTTQQNQDFTHDTESLTAFDRINIVSKQGAYQVHIIDEESEWFAPQTFLTRYVFTGHRALKSIEVSSKKKEITKFNQTPEGTLKKTSYTTNNLYTVTFIKVNYTDGVSQQINLEDSIAANHEFQIFNPRYLAQYQKMAAEHNTHKVPLVVDTALLDTQTRGFDSVVTLQARQAILLIPFAPDTVQLFAENKNTDINHLLYKLSAMVCASYNEIIEAKKKIVMHSHRSEDEKKDLLKDINQDEKHIQSFSFSLATYSSPELILCIHNHQVQRIIVFTRGTPLFMLTANDQGECDYAEKQNTLSLYDIPPYSIK